MEFRHLRYVLAVAEELNFRKAAEKLYISQPPLSRQIKEFEQALQVQLFDRNNKRVILTEAGSFFVTETKQMLQSFESIILKTRKIHENTSGEFRIGYISSTFSGAIAKLVQHLSACYPYVNFKLYEVPTIKQIAALEQGKLDLGILRAPILSPKIATKLWFKDHFSLIYNRNNCQVDSDKDIAQFKEATFVFFNKDYALHYNTSLLAICAKYGFVPKVMHEVNNVNSIVQLVKNGMGVSIVPSSVAKNCSYEEIGNWDLKHISESTEVLLATSRDKNSEITGNAIDYLKRKV
ncbi:MAG: LysR substrate-binding domain-containing protein [Bacteroidota bacterium]